MDKEFFENGNLYEKYSFSFDDRPIAGDCFPSIQLECPCCGSERTWIEESTRVRVGSRLSGKEPYLEGVVVGLQYKCAACGSKKRFVVACEDGTVTKVGEHPAPSIKIDKPLENAFGDYATLYKCGRISELHGFGIGAFAYYRRVVEGTIGHLLEAIAATIEGDAEKAKYSEALKLVANSHTAQEKIDFVKDLVPPNLRPGNMNPLGILFRSLSEGIHSLNDNECLKDAKQIRVALEFLIRQIDIVADAKAEFTESMQKLLDKKSTPDMS